MPARAENDRRDPPGSREPIEAADSDPPILPVLVLALAVRLAVVLPQAPAFPGLGTPFDQYALRIAAGYGFGPSSLLPPLYPYFLAMLYRVYGYSHHAVVLSQVVLGSIAVVSTVLLARAAGLRGWRLYAAGWMAALFPAAVAEVRHLTPVLLASAFFGLGAWLWLRGGSRPSRFDALLAGLLCGGAVLARTGMILPIVVVALAAPLGPAGHAPRSRGDLLWRRGVLLAVVVATLAPWTLRNTVLPHRPALTETTWALRLRMATVPGTLAYRPPATVRDARAPDNVVLSDNDIAVWEVLGYTASHPGEVVRTWGARLARILSFDVDGESTGGDPFPYRYPWYRLAQALAWGTLLTLSLSWVVMGRAVGGIERSAALAVAGIVLLGIVTATLAETRILAAPFLAVTAARGAEGLRDWTGRSRLHRCLFLALVLLLWLNGLFAPGRT